MMHFDLKHKIFSFSNEKLGGNEQFNCKECKMQLDRDMNTCRNILIKGLK